MFRLKNQILKALPFSSPRRATYHTFKQPMLVKSIEYKIGAICFNAKSILFPLGSYLTFVFKQRISEMYHANTLVKQSNTLKIIYNTLSQFSNEYGTYHFSNTMPLTKAEDADSFFESHKEYKKFTGRAPIENGSYYFGTHRRGGVLGDIFIDLDAEEFNSSKQKLITLKSQGLSTEEVIDEFAKFFNQMILDNSSETCPKLKTAQKISRSTGIMPLSSILFLGHGDCRPHALAIAALLNHAGILCEYANFKEALQYKNQEGQWEAPVIFDHSIVIYQREDGEYYTADSYFNEFNNLPLDKLKSGFQNDVGTKRYQFIEENKFPIIYVKNPTIHYSNISFSIRFYGDQGGFALSPNTKPKSITVSDPQVIKDLGTVWDIKKLERGNSPVKIGVTDEKDAFTTYRGIRVLDMPIRLRGDSMDYKIPNEVFIFKGTLQSMIDHAHSVLSEEEMKRTNAYLTIDQTWVEKGKTQRIGGIHTDGFQGSNSFGETINHAYLVSNHVPTAFFMKPFYFNHLDPRVHNYNLEMDRQGQRMKPQYTDEYGIYCINAYTPHAATEAKQSGYRTFIRLIYDKNKYKREGNSINRLLDYDWEMIPNTNLTRLFNYAPSTKNGSLLISKVRSCINLNKPLPIQQIKYYLENVKKTNRNRYYNIIHRLFILDHAQLNTLLLSTLASDRLTDYSLLKLTFIPLGSKHETTRKLSEDCIYETFKSKIAGGKIHELHDLFYEIMNDTRYQIDKEKFNALFSERDSTLRYHL